jgi:hypothetical protein
MYKLASIEEIFVVMEDHNMTIQNMLGNYILFKLIKGTQYVNPIKHLALEWQ